MFHSAAFVTWQREARCLEMARAAFRMLLEEMSLKYSATCIFLENRALKCLEILLGSQHPFGAERAAAGASAWSDS